MQERKKLFFSIDNGKKIDILELSIFAIIGGIVGVIVETFFVLFVNNVLVKRFIFVLPISHVFVWATILIYILFHSVLPKLRNLPIVFILSTIIMGSFEAVTGTFLDFIGIELWNYRNMEYTITDYTTLPICIGWGLLGIFYVMIAQPILLKLVGKIPRMYRKRIILSLIIIYLLDLVFSIIRVYTNPDYIYKLVYPS